MARRKGKVKKKRVGKTSRRVFRSPLQKRRGRDVYDIFFKPGHKTEEEIEVVISKCDFRKIKIVDEFVKITFVAGNKRVGKASISYIYQLDYETESEARAEIKQNNLDINYTTFRKIVKGVGDSLKRYSRVKNFLNRIIIDFESATNS